MAVFMSHNESREVFFGFSHYVGRGIATYAKINNSTLIGLHNLSAIAASAIALNPIFKSSTARTHTAFLTAISDKYSVLKTTLDAANSSLFSKTNKEFSKQTTTYTPVSIISAANGLILMDTYKMSSYGGSANDTTAIIKHASADVVSKTWQPGTGNNTQNMNAVGVGGVNITASGSYPAKIHYGIHYYTEYVAL